MITDQQKVIEKANNKQRLVVKGIGNRLLMQFSFKNIKTWNDVYKITGFSDEYIKSNFPLTHVNSPVTIVDIRSWNKKLLDDLEDKLAGRVVAPVVVPTVITTSVPAPAVLPSLSPSSAVSVPDESGFNNSNDYGLCASAKEKAYLFWFQKKAVKELLDKIVGKMLPAVMVLASTGTGKTFIMGALDRRLKDTEFHKDKTWGHVNYLAITRATVVEQTKRVLNTFFGIEHPIDTEVINIEQLRSRAGQMWIDSKSVIENGEEVEKYEWKKMINPCVIYLDECQAVKNDTSTQHKIMTAFSNIDTPTTQVFISATPFTRVSEAKSFAIATRKDISHLGFPPGTRLSANTWSSYAAAIAAPSPPDEYNEAAVERLMKDLDDYIVRVKGVRWQFNAINNVEVIGFDSEQTRLEYANAWERYLIRKAKLEESVTDSRMQAMVELGIFLAAAEYAKRYIFAERMYRDVQAGKAAVLACKFKKTIIGVVKILNDKYGVSRDTISLIWGGGQTQLTAKQKMKMKVLQNQEVFNAAGISMEDLMLEDVEERILEDLPENLRLGGQTKEERQKEIDKFQSGRSLYAIYTFKAGGVGLSLHHTDEQTKQKVRRQKNGYAVVEDIPSIPTRPRKVTVSPTWSPIEMVQGVGRVPRLTSLSDSEQTLLFYRGTVEEDQAYVVTHRLKCLSKVVRQHESWQDLISNHVKSKEIARQLVENGPTPDKEGEEHDGLTGGEDEEE